jgi:hypothetical protein
MRGRRLRHRVGLVLVVLAFVATLPRTSRASDIILPGYDLLDPLPGTRVFLSGFGLVPFVGVPFGTFDFGSGPVATGSTDTIIYRPVAAHPGASITVHLIAMQLVSTAPIDLGLGLDFYYLTLQAAPMPPGNTGTMTFSDSSGNHAAPPPPHGTVTYDPIHWAFDARRGGLGGPIALSDTKTLTSGPIPWSHVPPPGTLLIPGANFLLGPCDDGTPPADAPGECDFFFVQPFALADPDGTTVLVPEPGTLALVGLSVAGLRVWARRRQPPIR